MHRRTFIEFAIGGVAAGALGGCASRTTRSGAPSSSGATNAAAFGAARRLAETRFGKIAYVERGTGNAALFLHGFPLNGFQWRGALDRLSAHRRCVAPDFMGLGYSEIIEGQSLDPGAQTAMLVALLDALSISSVDLVANDSGGPVAQLFMVQHPDRVRTLLLTDCDVHENSPPAQMRASIEAARAGLYDQKMARHLEDRAYARSPKGIGGAAYTNPANFTDDAIDYYLRPLVASPLRRKQLNSYLAAFEQNPLLAIEPALRRCTTPTRMVWGTADPLFPVAWAEWLARTLPGSRGVRLVEGGKLFWPEEMPDLLADEARALWDV